MQHQRLKQFTNFVVPPESTVASAFEQCIRHCLRYAAEERSPAEGFVTAVTITTDLIVAKRTKDVC